MHIGFLVFDNITQLDMAGPYEVLSRLPGARALLVAKTLQPVGPAAGFRVVPDVTFETAPYLDILVAPGGLGVDQAMNDPDTINFVRRTGAAARYVTSVCTGSLILGVAGLLRGKRATTHWAYTDILSDFGAIHTPGRVVRDGNVFTGGGVTAGIDFGLTLAGEIAGPQTAQTIQLSLEYDPHPPYAAGTINTAPAHVGEAARAFYAKRVEQARAAVSRAMEALDPAVRASPMA